MDRHVLALDLEFNWKDPNFNHLAYIQADRKGNHVAALFCIPIDQHVWRCTDPPSIAWQVNEEVLDVHLTYGLRARTSDRKPLLWEYSGEPFATEVAEYASGSKLPLVLPQARIARCRKDEAGARSQ